ncbi:MAG: hypothetical protein ABS75_32285 [Pelagibacterium sp. SCN 63-23]|nr:MAG: hypothetical protein ABS75_32285 [Pelagibacterium sp. SCN 63-23]
MLTSLNTQDEGTTLTAPICIVGAGAAGITLALELAEAGIDCLLLEGGGLEFEDLSQALYEGSVTGLGQTDIAYSRLRQFGGTTGHWTGLCAPLSHIDFEARNGVPHSGWPIQRADLDPFYERAQTYLQLGPYAYDVQDWAQAIDGTPWPLDPMLVESTVYQNSPPTRFAEVYQDAIARSERIQCFYHANVTDLEINEAGAVTRAKLVSFDGRTVFAEARHFILACGGVENARLLLNFDKQRSKGLGNENDLVGRYFMDHMNCTLGEIVPADPQVNIDFYQQHNADHVPLLIALRLTDEVLRRENVLHTSVFLDPVWESESHNDDFRDHSWLAFSAIARAFAKGQIPDQLWPRLCTIAKAPGAVATGIYRNAMRRFVPEGSLVTLRLRQDAEQSPNPDSRVFLNGQRDSLGLRRVTLDWRLTDHDLLSLRRTHEIIGQAVGAAGLGRLRLGIDDPPSFDQIFTGYHHMGTTRMHSDPRRGVVDANCKVHDLANLHIAGSSVFTTGGTANPTLTITALAIRLADHLAGQI